ncbi:MAG: virulence RhuM family protein [Erysipelotrichaceae bacterium]|nr:virulence RhuM family protein [Erysipelotrichaceae bacterium]
MEKGLYEYMCKVNCLTTYQNKYWLIRSDMASLLNVSVSTIDELINDIFNEKELNPSKVSMPMQVYGIDNGIQYSFDVLLALAFRLHTKEALELRQWVVQVFDEYLYKGSVLDDMRLKMLLGQQTFYHIQRTLDFM